jgi:hypothetical protein
MAHFPLAREPDCDIRILHWLLPMVSGMFDMHGDSETGSNSVVECEGDILLSWYLRKSLSWSLVNVLSYYGWPCNTTNLSVRMISVTSRHVTC